MSTKTHAKVLNGTGESVFVVEHAGIEVKGSVSPAVADAGTVETSFDSTGTYIVSDDTNGDSAIIMAINTGGTLSLVKSEGSAAITITKDTALSVNVYIENNVIVLQNLTGGDADISIKPFA